MSTAVIVYSGGLDSTVLLAQARQQYDKIVAVNFAYGSKHNEAERKAATKITSLLDVDFHMVDLQFINHLFVSDLLKSGGEIPEGHYEAESMKRTVVPFRNGIMLSIAAGFAESIRAEAVLIATHHGDHAIYPDCRPEFNRAMQLAIKRGTDEKVYFRYPFQNMAKGQIVRLGVTVRAPLQYSYSCYKGAEVHCGRCGTCSERIEAFQQAGFIDPVPYAIEIDWKECEKWPVQTTK
jgi:7-cyano-7-deazaguanine synthase